MTDRKDLIIAILATFCLTVTLFGILPTRSSSVNPYDPWLDFNDDGVINMRDIGATVNAFGASGDPTKNVTVTNWPEQKYELRLVYNESLGQIPSDVNNYNYVTTVDVTGYRYVTIHASANGTWTDNANFYVHFFWNSTGILTDGGTVQLWTGSGPYYPAYRSGKYGPTYILSTKLSLYVQLYNSPMTPNINLLTIVVYLQD